MIVEMMEIWNKVVKALATVGGAIAGIFGEWSILMTILAAAMVLDYISGVLVAAFGKSLKSEGGHLGSKVGFVGLAKKALIIMIVLLATLLDKALGAEAMVFQTATVCYYIANEGISVVENAGLMGLPVPSTIAKALEQMRDKNKGE